jgi:plastocyanin
MRAVKLSITLAVFLVFALVGHAEDAKQTAAPAAGPEVKQKLPQAAVPEARPAEHPAPGGPGAGEKRFVATVGPDGVQHVEIAGGEYYFEPNHIVLKVNVPAEFTVKKAKDSSWFIPHDIVVKAPEAGIDFKVGLKKEPQSVKFTPTRVGTYEMFCDEKMLFFKSHKNRGMKGVVEVVE